MPHRSRFGFDWLVLLLALLVLLVAHEAVYRITTARMGGEALGTVPDPGLGPYLVRDEQRTYVAEGPWLNNLHYGLINTGLRIVMVAVAFALLVGNLIRQFVQRVDEPEQARRNWRGMQVFILVLLAFWALIGYELASEAWQKYETSKAALATWRSKNHRIHPEGHHDR
jgi:hypothetical protein